MSVKLPILAPQVQIEALQLATKDRSYGFGRRLYRFNIAQQGYWLKFHLPQQHHAVLEISFQAELAFYQAQRTAQPSFLLPYQLIQFAQYPELQHLATQGEGLILADSAAFFTDIYQCNDINFIKQKILIALEALDTLHQSGWIHGDLKTEHFRDHNGCCSLIDFEQSFAKNQPISEMNATPHYMAPELFHGTAKSMQSDLYAFGIILYEWLMRTRLQANSYQDWAVLHCQQLVLQLPPHFACFLPLLNGLTQKQHEQRFKAVFEAKNTLNNINLH